MFIITLLFIVGNGFDLNHELKTKYRDLKNLIQCKDKKLYNDINNQLFGVENDDNHNLINDLWSKFELNVGVNDSYFEQLFYNIVNETYDEASSKPSGGNPMDGDVLIQKENNDYAIKQFIDSNPNTEYDKELFENLRDNFIEYLNELLLKADRESAKKNPKTCFYNIFYNDSKFINFNYTHTLENIYSINNNDILYIHGELGKDELAFGNSINNIIELDSSEFHIEDEEYNEYIKLCNEYNNLPADKKKNIEPPQTNHDYTSYPNLFEIDISDIINRHNDLNNEWIKELNLSDLQKFIKTDIFDKVVVLGHSLGEVDKKYFQSIHLSYPNIKWYISYHDDKSTCKENFYKILPNQTQSYVHFFKL